MKYRQIFLPNFLPLYVLGLTHYYPLAYGCISVLAQKVG